MDTITDFNPAQGDVLKTAHPFTSSYTRTDYVDGTGLAVAFNTGGTNLPKVFNFEANNNSYTTASGVANFLANFRLTTDGSTAISTPETVMIVTGDGNNSMLWSWNESGNGGTVDASELIGLAQLNNLDNDTLTSSNFANGAF